MADQSSTPIGSGTVQPGEAAAAGGTPAIVTFLFTNIDNGAHECDFRSEQTRLALALHDRIVAEAVEAEQGRLIKDGDHSIRAVFDDAASALRATLSAQLALKDLAGESAACAVCGCVRMALHSGVPERYEDIYSGPAVSRAAALATVGQGGQILLSGATRDLVGSSLPYRASLRDLGVHGLSDSPMPVRIWQFCHPDLPSRFGELRTRDLSATNIPMPATAFVGRRGEITRIRALLKSSSIVALVGGAGIGKTRLALEVGLGELETRRDGVWLVSLESVTEGAQIAGEVAAVLGIREEPGRPLLESVGRSLQESRALLIIDHYDGLDAACATVIEELHARCPSLAVLATGSMRLGIAAVKEYATAAMAPPPPEECGENAATYALVRYEAVRLFLERARRVRPTFELPEAPILCALYRQLGGNPLAIELAAARADLLSAAEISDSLSGLPTLAAERGSPPADGQPIPLTTVLEWSFGQLGVKVRLLLLRLSVFAGGWTLEDAEAVCADGVEPVSRSPETRIAVAEIASTLEALVQRGLVARFDSRPASQYALPHPVLQFCRERRRLIREDHAIRRAHCRYFARLARAAWEALGSPQGAEAAARLEPAAHNLRAALSEAAAQATMPALPAPDGAIDSLLTYAASLEPFWQKRGAIHEGRAWLATALETPGARRAGSARAMALLAAAGLAREAGAQAVVAAHVEEAVAIYRSLGDARGIARSLQRRAELARERGDLARAEADAAEALAFAKGVDRPGAADALDALSRLAWLDHDLLVASQLGSEAVSIRRQASHERAVAHALGSLGRAALERSDVHVGRDRLRESLGLWHKLRDTARTAATLESMAVAACLEENALAAASLYHAARRIGLRSEPALSGPERDESHATREWLRRKLGDAPLEPGGADPADIDQILASA